MKYPHNSSRRSAIDSALVSMIVNDMQPVSICEDQGFIQLVHQLDSRYPIPSRRTLMREMLPKRYDEKRLEIQTVLNDVSSVSLTTDIWSSIQNIGYMTITAHCLTAKWDLKSLVLQTRELTEAHTGAYIASTLQDSADEWHIADKVVGIATDNASNATAAVAICGWRHVPCLAHTLNLVVKDALAVHEPHQSTIKQVKDIVTFFHRSIKASDELRKVQKQLNLPELKVIQECETRWNSTFFMLERYIELHPAVTTSLCLLSRNNLCISTEKLDIVAMIVEALRPFELATRELSADKYTSVSKVIPLIHQLQSLCSEKAETNSLSRLLSRELVRRFTGIENSYVLAVSSYCDPRFKKLAFKDKRALEQAQARLTQEILQSATESRSTPPLPSTESANTSNPESLWSSFDKKVTEVATTRQVAIVTRIDCDMELKMYCNDPVLNRKEDPLLWWKNNEAKFPNLAKIAKKYLGIPATSVPSERLFSKAGELVSKKRNRLKPKNVDLILFLNQHVAQ